MSAQRDLLKVGYTSRVMIKRTKGGRRCLGGRIRPFPAEQIYSAGAQKRVKSYGNESGGDTVAKIHAAVSFCRTDNVILAFS